MDNLEEPIKDIKDIEIGNKYIEPIYFYGEIVKYVMHEIKSISPKRKIITTTKNEKITNFMHLYKPTNNNIKIGNAFNKRLNILQFIERTDFKIFNMDKLERIKQIILE